MEEGKRPFHFSIPFHPSCPESPSSAKCWQEPPGSELRAASSELAPGRACAPSSWGLTGPNNCVTCHLLHFEVCLLVSFLNKGSISSAPRARCSSVIYSAAVWQVGTRRRSNISSLEPSPASAPYLQRSTGRASSGTRAPGMHTRKVTSTKAD